MNEAILAKPPYAEACERWVREGFEVCLLVPPASPYSQSVWLSRLEYVEQLGSFNVGIRSRTALALRTETDWAMKVPLRETGAYTFLCSQGETLRFELPNSAVFVYIVDEYLHVSEHRNQERVIGGRLAGAQLVMECGVLAHGLTWDAGSLATVVCEGEIRKLRSMPTLMEALTATGRLRVENTPWLLT